METQIVIAKQIHDEGGFYVLALKGNQGRLKDDVRLFLESELKKNSSSSIEDTCMDLDKAHGRIEKRTGIASSQIDWLSQKPDWARLKTIAMIEEMCHIKGKIISKRRFFISLFRDKIYL